MTEGDRVRVESPRGALELAARITTVRSGTVFVPFHYGSWDTGRSTAANELTITSWDGVSKQPIFKVAAVRLAKVADGGAPAPAPTTTGSMPAAPGGVPATLGGPSAASVERVEGR